MVSEVIPILFSLKKTLIQRLGEKNFNPSSSATTSREITSSTGYGPAASMFNKANNPNANVRKLLLLVWNICFILYQTLNVAVDARASIDQRCLQWSLDQKHWQLLFHHHFQQAHREPLNFQHDVRGAGLWQQRPRLH